MPDLRLLSVSAIILMASQSIVAWGQGRGQAAGAPPPIAENPAGGSFGADPSGMNVMPAIPMQGGYGAVPGMAGGGYGAAGVAQPMGVVNPNRALQPGDQLAFRIDQDKEPAVKLVVTPGGDLLVEPLDHAVRVVGMNTAQVSAELKRQLEKDYYYTATVRLNLLSVDPGKATGSAQFTGQMARTGLLPLYPDRPMKLSEAITAMGGFGKYADDRRVKVTRSTGAGVQTLVVDVKSINQEGKLDRDLELRDGDKVFVPELFFKR